MAKLRNKQKLAAISTKAPELPRDSQSQNTSVPGNTQDYITEVSEEVEGSVTKKLSQEFNATESPILGALSKLDELLLEPRVRTLSGTVLGTSRNSDTGNRDPTKDCSQNYPYPEV